MIGSVATEKWPVVPRTVFQKEHFSANIQMHCADWSWKLLKAILTGTLKRVIGEKLNWVGCIWKYTSYLGCEITSGKDQHTARWVKIKVRRNIMSCVVFLCTFGLLYLYQLRTAFLAIGFLHTAWSISLGPWSCSRIDTRCIYTLNHFHHL